MKKLLLSSVALLGFTAGAMAADLPRRAAPQYFAPIPVFTWTGFYVGVNAGYGWSSDDNNNGCFGCFGGGVVTVDTTPGGATVAPVALPNGAFGFAGTNVGGDRDGFVGGAQVGFNYQFTPGSGFVVGVEADIQWLGGDNDRNNGFFGTNLFNHAPVAPFLTPGAGIVAVPVGGSNVALFNNGGFGNNRNNQSDWFATARLRVGYAFDRVLVYATGGLAFTDNGNNNNGFFGITNGSQLPAAFYVSPAAAAFGAGVGNGGFFGKNNNNDVGWVLGAGVEYAFTNNLTVKLEGLWVSMDNNNNNNFGFGNGVIGVSNTGAPIRSNAFFGGNNNNDNEFFVARVGLNWKFGS